MVSCFGGYYKKEAEKVNKKPPVKKDSLQDYRAVINK